SAQENPAALDPSDVFFQAYLTIRDAEKLEEAGKHSDAWRKYRQASKYYDLLARYHKNWKPHLVEGRVESTREAIKTIEPKAAAEIAGKDARTRDLVEGGSTKRPAPTSPRSATNNERVPNQPKVTPQAPAPRIAKAPTPTADPRTQRKLRQLQVDNRRLSDELAKIKKQAPSNTKEQQRLVDMIAKKDREIGTLRDILARAPLQQDMDRLTKENRTRERELALTAQALKRTQQKLTDAERQRTKHQEDAMLAEKRLEELKKNMEAQKTIDNRVVRKLRQELKSVTDILQKTRQELGSANTQITKMQLQLKQADATIKELTTERNALRLERDTLAGILKKSDSKGVQKLITENMRLGTELKQALDRLQYLEKSQDSTKNELLQAKSDLAIAKTRIMRYQQEHASKNKMIQSLEKRLRDAQAELANAIANPAQKASQEEVNTLRATVKRLIAAQERRKMGEKTLWEAYQKSGQTIANMARAFSDIRKTNIELSKEEKAMVAAARVPDSEFTSPERVSAEHARVHGDALEKEIAMYTPLMKRFFEKGRFEAARETLLELDTRFPGHFPTLCNRGVVEIKTGRFEQASEIFNEAITMRENSGYAHYMLGKTQYLLKDFDNSQKSFEHSLSLKSDNADAHLYLGNIAGAGRRYQQAEKHFQEALKINPTNAEAYFNLSVIYLQQNKKKDAQESYRKALHHGAQPDPGHEQKLSSI
ncbi:MAG: tetratricopeptide repeat protein, partial [Akkermansiaceae bacterium]